MNLGHLGFISFQVLLQVTKMDELEIKKKLQQFRLNEIYDFMPVEMKDEVTDIVENMYKGSMFGLVKYQDQEVQLLSGAAKLEKIIMGYEDSHYSNKLGVRLYKKWLKGYKEKTGIEPEVSDDNSLDKRIFGINDNCIIFPNYTNMSRIFVMDEGVEVKHDSLGHELDQFCYMDGFETNRDTIIKPDSIYFSIPFI